MVLFLLAVVFCVCSMFFCILLGDLSSFSIILIGKREVITLLCLSFCFLVICYMALSHDAVGWSAVCNCAMY